MKVESVMTPCPFTCSPKTSILEATRALSQMQIRHLPVLEGNELVGMISDRDLESLSLARLGMMEPAEATIMLNAPVQEIMENDVVSVSVGTSVGAAIDLFLEHKFGAMPVLDNNNRFLEGIVSYMDVLRVSRDFFR